MTLSPGLPVPLPASSISEQIHGKARQKRSIVISLTCPISVVSKLCSNTFNVYPSRSFGWVWEKTSYRNASPHHHSGKTRMRIYISMKNRVFWGPTQHTSYTRRPNCATSVSLDTCLPLKSRSHIVRQYAVVSVISVTPRTFLRRSLDPGIQGISISACGWLLRGDPARYSG
ncbi:hypothetical protein ARMGADRAFT_582691 [Armillaria gallica]|uniref:Uncharacterized protein n=1 Tax=Armillaria gallica TaxID=47427 RepID=A0A2H3E617_ARMGA|nr:hypothetical protein ARMGADRAFT_582691 [Armillaria gallica]